MFEFVAPIILFVSFKLLSKNIIVGVLLNRYFDINFLFCEIFILYVFFVLEFLRILSIISQKTQLSDEKYKTNDSLSWRLSLLHLN